MSSAARLGFLGLLLCVSWLHFAAAQDLSPVSVTGTVVNAATGEAVPYALVQLSGSPSRAMLTDHEGLFQFDGVPPGRMQLYAQKPGFFNDIEMHLRVPLRTAAAGLPAITLTLLPEAVIQGHMEDENGDPIEGAQVRTTKLAIENGRREQEPVGLAVTDEDGAYRVAHLRPGIYRISAGAGDAPPQFAPPDTTSNVGFPLEVFYPGVRDPAGAAAIRLATGQQLQADFTLPHQPVYRISGMIGPAPVKTVNIRLRSALVSGAFSKFTMPQSPAGHFEIDRVPAGHYWLSGDETGPDGVSAYFDAPIDVTSNRDDLRLNLLPTRTIPVVEQTQFSAPPLPMLTVGNGPRLFASVQLRLISGNPYELRGSNTRVTPSGDRITEVRGLRPGIYAVEFHPFGPYYVASAYCGAVDLLREPLTATDGSPTDPIVYVLRDDGGRLSASVRLNDQDSGATVLLYSAANSILPPSLIDIPDRDAHSIQNIPPGDYIALAFDRLDDLEYTNREAMAPYLARGTQVSISAGASASITLDLIRRSE